MPQQTGEVAGTRGAVAAAPVLNVDRMNGENDSSIAQIRIDGHMMSNIDKRTKVAAAILASLALVLAGCGDGETRNGGRSAKSPAGRPKATASPAAVFADPPVRFDANHVVEIPRESRPDRYTTEYGALPVVIDGRTAVTVVEGALTGVDIITGRQTWQAAPSNEPLSQSNSTRAVVVTLQGRRTALAASMTKIPGQGTTPSGAAIELIGVDLGSGRTVVHDTLPLPRGESSAGNPVKVVGADPTTVVLSWDGGTLVADPATHEVRWVRYGFRALGLDGGVIAGQAGDLLHYRMLGLRAADQRQAWASKEYEVPFFHADSAGPGLYSLYSSTGALDENTTVLYDVKSGTPRKHLELEHSWHCVFDGARTVLCQQDGLDLVALDAGTLDTLWRLPSHGRLSPAVTAFWHGAVYGKTSNGPVVLDARSGKDREVNPGAAPRAVSGYGGLDTDPEGEWRVFPTAR